jgi:hypothetical protein
MLYVIRAILSAGGTESRAVGDLLILIFISVVLVTSNLYLQTDAIVRLPYTSTPMGL